MMWCTGVSEFSMLLRVSVDGDTVGLDNIFYSKRYHIKLPQYIFLSYCDFFNL